jgi:hypothetical protein
MEKSATVYKKAGQVLVVPESTVVGTAWYGHGPIRSLPATASDTDLGTAVLGALEASRWLPRFPPREEIAASEKEQWRAFRVRSRSQFAANTLNVSVSLEAGALQAMPSTFGGPQIGWKPLTDQTVSAVNLSPASVGAAVREAIERAS